MPADLTLPGTLPGLLRRGSPILDRNEPGVVVRLPMATLGEDNPRVVMAFGRQGSPPLSVLALDLTDPTGRAHAAWWARERLPDSPDMPGSVVDWMLTRNMTTTDADRSDADIARLRDLCLRLAEVARG
jgi:hypothetical protein